MLLRASSATPAEGFDSAERMHQQKAKFFFFFVCYLYLLTTNLLTRINLSSFSLPSFLFTLCLPFFSFLIYFLPLSFLSRIHLPYLSIYPIYLTPQAQLLAPALVRRRVLLLVLLAAVRRHFALPLLVSYKSGNLRSESAP